MLEPARTVIEICGGARRVSDLCGRELSRVYRWTYAREKGGTGGLIPSEVQPLLLEQARAAGIDLRPEHFFVTKTGDVPGSDPAPPREAAE
jgi:hypothetical protein